MPKLNAGKVWFPPSLVSISQECQKHGFQAHLPHKLIHLIIDGAFRVERILRTGVLKELLRRFGAGKAGDKDR